MTTLIRVSVLTSFIIIIMIVTPSVWVTLVYRALISRVTGRSSWSRWMCLMMFRKCIASNLLARGVLSQVFIHIRGYIVFVI